jgi:hypothetical protein
MQSAFTSLGRRHIGKALAMYERAANCEDATDEEQQLAREKADECRKRLEKPRCKDPIQSAGETRFDQSSGDRV